MRRPESQQERAERRLEETIQRSLLDADTAPLAATAPYAASAGTSDAAESKAECGLPHNNKDSDAAVVGRGASPSARVS